MPDAPNLKLSIASAYDLAVAAKLAVRGVDNSEVTTGLGKLIDLILEHLSDAESFGDALDNISKENVNA